MKVVVAGGRYYTDWQMASDILNYFLSKTTEPIEIVSGACDRGTLTYTRPDGTMVYGADGLGERYAHEKGYPVKLFPADWQKYGKKAAYFRNRDMSLYGTHAIIFWDMESTGSKMMYDLAMKARMKKIVLFNTKINRVDHDNKG